MTALELEFHQEMLAGSAILKTQHGYNPTYFLQMVGAHGGVGAVHRLLEAADFQSGLTSLWEIHRLDLSCETAALNPKYASLFTSAEKKEARKRLAAMNYTPQFGAVPP